jgi:hypothetical protein
MQARGIIRFAACAIVTAYGALTYLLIGGTAEAVELASWAIAPLALLLAVVLIASKPRTLLLAFALLLLIAVTGAMALMWGLLWNPGDFNHLVVIFLPLYQFGFVALALMAFAVVSLRGAR